MPKKTIKKKLRKNPKKDVIYGKEYELYGVWKSLPAVWRGKGADMYDTLGIEDEVVRMLLEIRTQTKFAEKYKISIDTLTDWNKKLEDDDELFKNRKRWVKKLMAGVLAAVHRKALVEGDKGRAEFLAEYAGEMEHGGVLRSPELAEQTKVLRKILEKR